jgi:hypothetical protein
MWKPWLGCCRCRGNSILEFRPEVSAALQPPANFWGRFAAEQGAPAKDEDALQCTHRPEGFGDKSQLEEWCRHL